jgi:hypothetical protein
MQSNGIVFIALAFAATGYAQAQDLSGTCHASSSYDLTVASDSLVFDRAGPAPRQIQLHNGKLGIDGAPVHLNTEDRDRLALFEQQLRALVPKARGVADNGVDLAVKAVRAETAGLGVSADTQAQLDAKLAARGAELKRRIAASISTHDWQGDAFDRYADDIAADIAPLLAADLAQQAVSAAVNGDLDAAASLRDRAADLTGDLRPRLERRMQALRPQVQALCPSIKRLYELQRDVRGANGRPLDLLDIEKK